ncbi:DUF6245 family protein [Nonomuraea fuscirosea]|uniref:DUF6245 family protein n=1 Tax=Nonomuraea fuscirosea TaxID=1291556 RepID=UPI00340756AF
MVSALIALGVYTGEGDQAEHDAEAERLGERRYRIRLANALLGAAQIEAMLAEQDVDLGGAHDEQLVTAGVSDDPVKLTGFLQWQTLRVAGPLRLVAQHAGTGPILVAAAHAADGLQRCSASWPPVKCPVWSRSRSTSRRSRPPAGVSST